jgi:2',3'-cyclic-nucleotide 2'-phosphodiesterase (5'-nucleotidase family)
VEGLVYTFNPNFPVGQRLISAQVKDTNGTLSDINPNAVYSVCTNSFVAQGGDGYSMIPPNAFNVMPFGPIISTTVIDYVNYFRTINVTLDGRIKLTNQTVSASRSNT